MRPNRFASLFLAFTLISLLAGCGGCNTPPERQAFSVAVSGRVGVEAGLATFKELARNGKVTKADFAKAKKALATYKEADLAYLDALEKAIDSKDPSAASTAQLALNSAYQALYQVLVIYVPKLDPNPPKPAQPTP